MASQYNQGPPAAWGNQYQQQAPPPNYPMPNETMPPPHQHAQPQPMFTAHQSYQQHQTAPPAGYQPYPAYPPRLVPFSRGWHVTKIVLRSFDMAFCATIIGLAVYFTSIVGHNGIWALATILPPATLALIWEVSELITICARGGKLGIHPGAHVGLHVLIWIGYSTCLGFATSVAIAPPSMFRSSTTYYSSHRRISESEMYEMWAVLIAITVFIGLSMILHFTLFVRACVETHQRNKMGPIVVVANTGGQTQIINQGHVPMPHQQPPMQSQQAYPAGMYPTAAPRGSVSQLDSGVSPVSPSSPPPGPKNVTTETYQLPTSDTHPASRAELPPSTEGGGYFNQGK